MMYIQEVDLKLKEWEFKIRKRLPYEVKKDLSETRIIDFNKEFDTYVSFSGGLDSTVLLHMVRKYLGKDIPAVFVDTGLEFPEIRKFVQRANEIYGNVITIKPDMSFVDVLIKHGYPVISKETAAKIRKLRHGNLSDKFRNYLLNGDERGKIGMCPKKWQKFADKAFPVDISEKCCDEMKKKPIRKWEKINNRYPFLGITQDESYQRQRQYERTGCNVLSGNRISSKPLGFWCKEDILRYIVEEHIEYCTIYGDIIKNANGRYITTGEQRTGCVYCLFGIHLEAEPNRIQRLHDTHPAIYDYIMRGGDVGEDGVIRPTPKYGLGYRKIQDPLGLNFEPVMQMSMFDRKEV